MERRFELVERCLKGQRYECCSDTSWNRWAEIKFASLYNVPYAITFNSGTSTLHSALTAFGVKEGDEVIIPAFTVAMDAMAVMQTGAKPVYADVNPDYWTIDPKSILDKITINTKAIIPVSIYGCPPDMDEIIKIANEYNLYILEDNAQSMLNYYKGKLLGTFGDAASYSFEASKILNCGEGGMIITSNRNLATKIRKHGGIGFKNLTAENGRPKIDKNVFQNPKYERHDSLGYNYRLSEVQAALLISQIDKVKDLVDYRIMCANAYKQAIADTNCKFLLPQKVPSDRSCSYWSFSARLMGTKPTWEDFRQEYTGNGGDGFYSAWQVTYNEPFINGALKNYCPVAEEVQKDMMQFKTNYYSMNDLQKIYEVMKKTIKRF